MSARESAPVTPQLAQFIEISQFSDRHFWHAGYDKATLRQQVGSLPAHIVATWRSRYVPVDGIDLEARAILNQEAAAVRAQGVQPDALTIWMRLTDQVARIGSPSPELLAAAALAGLAAGVRTQGFDKPAPIEGN